MVLAKLYETNCLRRHKKTNSQCKDALAFPSVFGDESEVRWDPVFGEGEGLGFVGEEVLGDGGLGEFGFELRGKQEAEVVVEGDETAVEGGVVEAGEGDAVADVEALGRVGAPGEDVRRNEEFADGELGDAAPAGVVVEDNIAEVFLTAAEFDIGGGFGGAGGEASADLESGFVENF